MSRVNSFFVMNLTLFRLNHSVHQLSDVRQFFLNQKKLLQGIHCSKKLRLVIGETGTNPGGGPHEPRPVG